MSYIAAMNARHLPGFSTHHFLNTSCIRRCKVLRIRCKGNTNKSQRNAASRNTKQSS
ncbi:hypothetical protein DPMN_110902 [Dreissena polymorpha]|uniref:Uncharacterized protein n=1 Tax=Dreissena polymorpha TaxID=45954 RepID=A0A9D4QNB7_DREPO|nr:hypothetical protein DPMN_110902 [Dreissena polymorpha]